MDVGLRLRQLREWKNLSQGDIEHRTGLLRCYISRVENGHTVPAIETLEKLSRALEVSLYQLFYTGEDTIEEPTPSPNGNHRHRRVGLDRKTERLLSKLRPALARMSNEDRVVLLFTAKKMVSLKGR